MILWGPPGTGKTTLARIIAQQTGAHFAALSAVSAGVADLRRVVADAQKLRAAGRRTVLFIDEIHRFNKAQQDAVLPYVEDGTVTLIGATTENPSFEVNSALLSRSRVFVLKALGDDDVRTLVERALHDDERGLGKQHVELAPDALDALVNLANGDARSALSTLEFAASAAPKRDDGARVIDVQTIADALQRRATGYDKSRRFALRHDQRVHQDDSRQRSRRGGLLARAHDRRGRGPAVHRAPPGDPRERGRRPGRPPRAAARDGGAAGGAFRRHAGGLLPARARGAVPRHGAEIEHGRPRVLRGAGRRAVDAQRPDPAASSQRADEADEEPRLRRRLPLRAHGLCGHGRNGRSAAGRRAAVEPPRSASATARTSIRRNKATKHACAPGSTNAAAAQAPRKAISSATTSSAPRRVYSSMDSAGAWR